MVTCQKQNIIIFEIAKNDITNLHFITSKKLDLLNNLYLRLLKLITIIVFLEKILNESTIFLEFSSNRDKLKRTSATRANRSNPPLTSSNPPTR